MKFFPFSFISLLAFSSGVYGQQPIYHSRSYTIYPDKVVQGAYTSTIISSTKIVSDYKSPQDQSKTVSSWKMTKDLSAFPRYHSGYKISDAVYNLALEEMQTAIEPDSTFRTGKEWGGVWTRDISYSIILSMAVLQPKVAVYSLMRKVKDGRIIQDTGSGGAYPVSSDRMIWGVAAWEVYKVTGDKDWLVKAYAIIKKSADDDYWNLYDKQTGLVRGESSFLDWREQTYPKWMQPADIYESECLSTNVVHYQVNDALSMMARILNDQACESRYHKRALTIKQGIQQQLWMPDNGYFGQYLYGRNYKMLSPRSEALGEALAVLFDAAKKKQAQTIIAKTPVNDFGIPCIYPEIPGIPPYHNEAVWPFVESYWAIASAKAGNELSVLRAISAIYRPAALFLTNRENFVAGDGDFAGTQINSSNMLWSLSGNIALVYKVLFGMQFQENRLVFSPFVPKALAGIRHLDHFKYRNALLNIRMTGYGNQIRSFTVDGKVINTNAIPGDLKGPHQVEIILSDNITTGKSNLQPDISTPETPIVSYDNGQLSWLKVPGAIDYNLYQNGKLFNNVVQLSITVPKDNYAEYQVTAVNTNHLSSFNSEPVSVIPGRALIIVEAENETTKSTMPYKNFSGNGFVEISKTSNTKLNIPVNIPEDGTYVVDFRYANGNGPINTENKCAIRTLELNGQFAGTVVFPQRGKDEWSNWGYSNSIKVSLNKGENRIVLDFKDANTNMNGDINQALIDYVRIIKLTKSK